MSVDRIEFLVMEAGHRVTFSTGITGARPTKKIATLELLYIDDQGAHFKVELPEETRKRFVGIDGEELTQKEV